MLSDITLGQLVLALVVAFLVALWFQHRTVASLTAGLTEIGKNQSVIDLLHPLATEVISVKLLPVIIAAASGAKSLTADDGDAFLDALIALITEIGAGKEDDGSPPAPGTTLGI